MPNVTSERLAIGLVFVAVAALGCLAPAQGDTWWLLRAGEDIWKSHSVPLSDSYSHTAYGAYWPNHEWLTELLLYVVHRVGGLRLIAAGTSLAIVTAWALSWRLGRGPFEPRFLLFGAALVPCAAGWAIRPQVFSYVMFMLVVSELVRGRYRWLPVIVLVWANLHGAVVLALVATGGAGLLEWLHSRRFPRAIGVAGVLAAGATCLTPLGMDLYRFIPESMARSAANQLIEWTAPNFDSLWLPFWAVGGVLLVMVVVGARRMEGDSARLVGIALAVLPLAMQSRRNVPVFLLVGVPAVLRLWPNDERTRLAPRGERTAVNAAILLISCVLAAGLVAVQWWQPAPRLGWRPLSETVLARLTACQGPLYNTYGDGGALIWFARIRVFIDNRQDPYPIDLLRESQTIERGGPIDGLVDGHGVQCAIVPAGSVVAATFAANARWRQDYSDVRWRIYSRVPTVNAAAAAVPTPR
jgi:hypothetical protein